MPADPFARPVEPTDGQHRSKDEFFVKPGCDVGEDDDRRHGKDFAIGALVLTAGFMAEGKEPLIKPQADDERVDERGEPGAPSASSKHPGAATADR